MLKLINATGWMRNLPYSHGHSSLLWYSRILLLMPETIVQMSGVCFQAMPPFFFFFFFFLKMAILNKCFAPRLSFMAQAVDISSYNFNNNHSQIPHVHTSYSPRVEGSPAIGHRILGSCGFVPFDWGWQLLQDG